MSDIQLQGGEHLRIKWHRDENFVDFRWLDNYDHSGLEMYDLDFTYWALVKVNNYQPYSLVMFPNKAYFDEWFELLDNGTEIIFKRPDVPEDGSASDNERANAKPHSELAQNSATNSKDERE